MNASSIHRFEPLESRRLLSAASIVDGALCGSIDAEPAATEEPLRPMLRTITAGSGESNLGPKVISFRITPRNPDRTSGSVQFIVTFQSDVGVNPTTLNNRDLRITGPNGFFRYARATLSQTPDGEGKIRQVRYKMPPPNRVWTENDNGIYTVRLRGAPDGVSDILGHYAKAQLLGTFTVNITRGDTTVN